MRKRFSAVAGAICGLAALPQQTLAQAGPAPNQGGPYHMMHDWGWGGGWGMIFGPLYMIAWLAILVAAILLVIRWMGVGGPGSGAPPRSARDILDERFARGDIDHEEYEKRRRTLSS
jgi:putative membrane protein